MGYAADNDYRVRIDTALVVESQAGNSGFQLGLSSEYGAIRHTLWITQNSLEMAKRQMAACGLTEADMGSAELWDDPASLFVGRDVTIHTKAETGQDGREWTRVAYIKNVNEAKPAGQDAKARGRDLLRGTIAFQPNAPVPAPSAPTPPRRTPAVPAPTPRPTPASVPDDGGFGDDIPFF